MEISHGGKKESKHNNRFCVSFDQFSIIYEAIQTIVNALFNSTEKIYQCEQVLKKPPPALKYVHKVYTHERKLFTAILV